MLVSLRRHSWLPANDNAILEIQLHDIPHRFLTTGAYSRFGWAHPGPIARLTLVPLYWVFGATGFALAVSIAALNIALLAVGVWMMREVIPRGKLVLILAICAVLTVLGLAGDVLVSPWNPYLATVALAATMGALAPVTQGRWNRLPIAGALGSLAIQAHVQTAVPVLLATAMAVVLGWRVARPDRRPIILTATVGLAMWSIPMFDAATHAGGNVRRIGGFALHNREPVLGLVQAAKVIGYWTSLRSPAIGFAKPIERIGNTVDVRIGSAPLPGVLFVVALVGCWLSRSPAVRSLGLVVAAAIVGTWLAMSHTNGSLYEYTFIWLQPLLILLFGCGATGFAERLAPRLPWLLAPWSPTVQRFVGLGAVVLVMGWMAVQPSPNPEVQKPLAALVPRIAHLAGDGGIRLTSNMDGGLYGLETGLIRPLERRGVPVATDGSWTAQLQYQRSEPVNALPIGLRWGCGRDPSVDPTTILVSFNPFSERELATIQRLHKVLASAGDDPYKVIATQMKLAGLENGRLCVDVVSV